MNLRLLLRRTLLAAICLVPVSIAFAADPPQPASLANISTRLRVQTGDNALIGGFIITGEAPKHVLVRALGPSLSSNGASVPGALADPILYLYNDSGEVITWNDNWRTFQETEIQQSGLAPSDNHESAISITLEPGSYTAIVRGVNNSSGIGLAEVYDLDGGSLSLLGNISTRGRVETDDNVMIGGFIIKGSQDAEVVVRALGPSLTQASVPGALADPTLELHDPNGALVAANDNWKETQRNEIEDSELAPSSDNESAIIRMLPPGAYTAIVRGKDGGTGVALVEAYNLVGQKIEGLWDSRVTIQDCQSGAVLKAFRAQELFIRGGSLIDTNAAPNAPTTRGPGFGRWEYLGGQRYTATFRFFRFNPDGTFAGVQKVTRAIELNADSNQYTGAVIFESFDANDQLIQTGCGTETSTRLE